MFSFLFSFLTMSQAFWVIQPRRNNPVIQLEKAWNEQYYLSAEDAKEALEEIQAENWTDEEKKRYDIADAYEIVALVADWPPSQFDKKPEHKSVQVEEKAPEEEKEEPDWVAALKDVSSIVDNWTPQAMQEIALATLGTSLTAWEINEPVVLELGDECKLRISPVRPSLVVKLSPEDDNV